MKDDIKKIDEQIKSILDNEKRIQEEKEEKHEVIVDQKYAYDNLEGDTKKVHSIKDIEEIEKDEKEDTKKIHSVSDIEIKEHKEKEIVEEDTDSKIINAIIVILIFINIFLISFIIFR